MLNNKNAFTKKIVFVHLYNDRSGSPKVLSQVISALKARGVKTEVVTSSGSDGFLYGVADSQRILFYRRSENKLLTLVYYLIAQVLLFFICMRYWRENVIFYVNTMMPFGAAIAAKLTGKKVVYHVHETSIKPKSLKSFLRFIIQQTATKVIFVSDFLYKEDAFKNINQFVVHNAIDSNFFDDVKESIRDGDSQDFHVLMVSSLKSYKGVFEFLRVAQLCTNNEKLYFTLVLNADQKEIASYLSAAVIPSNVTIYPRQANVKKFYESSDLLLNLSRCDEWVETFGLTIVEAMAYGLPSIVPTVGGPAEIVRDGIEGYLISSYEVEKISKKIQMLMLKNDVYNSLSKNSKLRAAQYNIKEFEEKIYNVIMSDIV